MPSIYVDGNKLRKMLRDSGSKQVDLSQYVGVTKYTVSRWCSDTTQAIAAASAKKVAAFFSITLEELQRRCGGVDKRISSAHVTLTEEEEDWLKAYRSLTPLDRAKVRVELDNMITKITQVQS